MTYQTKKLGEVLDYEQPSKYIVSSKNYSDDYKTPVLTAGKTFILGYTNEKNNIFSSEKLPVIIFDDFTTAIKFVDFPFKVKSSAMKILHAKKDKADITYLFYFLQTTELNHFTHKRYWISEYSNLEIPLPSLSEQKRIVKILDEKMGKITVAKKLREGALTDTEKILSQTLREIFEEGKKKGWEEKELGEVCIINPTKNLKGLSKEDEVTFVPMRAVDEYDQEIKIPEIRKIKEVEKGYTYFAEKDVLFAKITPCMENGKVAIARNLKNKVGFGTTEFHVLRANPKLILSEFIYEIVRSKAFRLEAEQRMTGSAGQKRVPKDFLTKYKIPLPPLTEQQKIVKRLDGLSAKIRQAVELQKSQLEDLKKLEKAYLREAFNGELV